MKSSGAWRSTANHDSTSVSVDETGCHSPEHDTWKGILWDLGFYVSFGVVIASSVQMAGVLLVFSFLIVPAVFSALFSKRLGVRLVLAYGLGAVVSAAGLWSSFKFDLPTGATVVVTFGVALLLGVFATLIRSRRAPAPQS